MMPKFKSVFNVEKSKLKLALRPLCTGRNKCDRILINKILQKNSITTTVPSTDFFYVFSQAARSKC